MSRPYLLRALGLLLSALLLAGAWSAGERQTQQLLQPMSPPAATPVETPPPVDIPFPPAPASPALGWVGAAESAADAARAADTPQRRLHQIWETNAQQPPAPPAQPLTSPSWFVSGVVQQGAQSQVMVVFRGESQVRFFKLGDQLPGGSKLLWVTPTAIGVLTPQKKTIQIPILDGLTLPSERPVPPVAAASATAASKR